MDSEVTMFPLGLPELVPIPGTRNYRLAKDFLYVTRKGKRIFIPARFITDGASIPRAFWVCVGDPFDPDYVCAALVHDWLWRMAGSWWQKTRANAMFQEILERQGVVGWMKRCSLGTGVWLGKVGWWFGNLWDRIDRGDSGGGPPSRLSTTASARLVRLRG